MSNAPPFDPQPAPPSKSWFGRNWLWFVPVLFLSTGCLCCLGCGGIFLGVLQTLKSSEPYKMALSHVQSDPAVIELLGEPITESGFMPFGEVSVEEGGGTATLYFQVRGPKGEASVSANATREAGQWRLTFVEVRPSDGSSHPIVWPPEAGQQIPDVQFQLDGDLLPAEKSPATDEATGRAAEESTGSNSDESSRD